MSLEMIWIYIGAAAAVTFLLRLFPLVFYSRLSHIPPIFARLTDVLPLSIMAILIVYCLRSGIRSPLSNGIPLLAGTLVTVIVHLLKKNTMLSIIIGTAVYMIILHAF